MHSVIKKISDLMLALRTYSLPISVMSWFVPFLYAALDGGNILYGIIALTGIIFLHLGTNIFDDAIDYVIAKRKIDKGEKDSFNFQKGKCICIFNSTFTIKHYFIFSFILFAFAALTGIFFISIYGFKLLYIILPAAFLCMLYPILGSLGFGEFIVAVIFSPFIYLGVFFVMKGYFSFDILLLSFSTGLLSVAVLHNHMLLDYNYDAKNRKITLCRICKSKKNAYYLLCTIIMCAYLNILFCCIYNKLNYVYLITFLSLPMAYTLIRVMFIHINEEDRLIKPNLFMGSLKELKNVDYNQKNFMLKFLIVRNLLSAFTILLCIAVVIDGVN